MPVPYERPPVPSEAERLKAEAEDFNESLNLSAAKFHAALPLDRVLMGANRIGMQQAVEWLESGDWDSETLARVILEAHL